MTHPPSEPDVRGMATKLVAYCHSNGWAGYDPYDALNSPLFKSFPVLNSRLPRLAFSQALKRSPVNFRSLMRIPKIQNPKALGLFLTSLLKAPDLGTDEMISSLKKSLIALRSPNEPYWCWGYSFPWQTRTLLVPRAVPNLVCSVFAGNALLDLYERRGDQDCRAMARSTASYILNNLYWTGENGIAGLGYPLPSMRNQVHNANFLGAAFLSRVYCVTGDHEFRDVALSLARYSDSCQRSDGSWLYGEAGTQQWIDNFHTGYNLCALQQIQSSLETSEFQSGIIRGFDFYRTHFLREDGAPRYYHNKTYPIDIHSVAQSIVTLLAFKKLDRGNRQLALQVLQWALTHMWDDRGFFYYRVLRHATIRTSYMRWSQAWMLLALSSLLSDSGEFDAVGTPVFASGNLKV
jgi:hypothetical protein